MTSLVQGTAALLRAIPRITLTELRGIPNASRTAPRPRGRVNGKYCGYGLNGQKARGKSSQPYVGFEGGQTPFYRRPPRHGRVNDPASLQSHSVSIDKILLWIDQGRINPEKQITMKVLRDSECVPRAIKRDGIYLIGNGKSKLTIPIDIEVSRASAPAIEAVERAGGKLMCTYYDPVTLRYHFWRDKYVAKGKSEPIRPLPSRPKMVRYYSDPKHNGYLSEKGDAHLIHSPEQFQRWQPRHIVRSKIWQQHPQWAAKRQEWADNGLIPCAEESYAWEDAEHWSNYKGPVSRYFGSDPELLPGKDKHVPGQVHKKGDSKAAAAAKKVEKPRVVNPNALYAIDYSSNK